MGKIRQLRSGHIVVVMALAIAGCTRVERSSYIPTQAAWAGRSTVDVCGSDITNPFLIQECLEKGGSPARTGIAIKPKQSPPKISSSRKVALYQFAVAEGLRDPESARFKDTKVVELANGREALCGEFNAKNAYGGYIGFEPFYADIFVGDGVSPVAVLWTSSKMGVQTVLDKCSGGK